MEAPDQTRSLAIAELVAFAAQTMKRITVTRVALDNDEKYIEIERHRISEDQYDRVRKAIEQIVG